DFPGGLVAHRKDEIQDRGVRTGEFVPALAAQTLGRQAQPFQQLKRKRMHRTLREAAGAVSFELSPAPMADQHLAEDAPRRVAGAQEQDVVCRIRTSISATSECRRRDAANTAELLQF